MSVKTIFKCLILTVLISVVGLMLVEIYNIAMISPMVRVLMNRNLSQACQLFAQETYKQSSDDGKLRGVADRLVSAEGGDFSKNDMLMSGNLYMRKTNDVASNSDVMHTKDEVYNFIYNSDEFRGWYANTPSLAGKFKELDKLAYALKADVPDNVKNSLTKEDIADGKRDLDSQMTALNIGATYLDKTTITNIARYQLVATLMNNIPSNLVLNSNTDNDTKSGMVYSKDKSSVDGRDEPYVKFNGFWVYWDTLEINSIDYKVYDLGYVQDNGNYTEVDKINTLEFQELTGIQVKDYIQKSKITEDDERRYVVVAELSYSCKVRYEGTTALSKVIKYAFSSDRRVQGLTDGDKTKGTDVEAQLNSKGKSVIGRNKTTTDGSQIVTDKIIYYNIR